MSIYNIRNFGAVGDGSNIDHPFIQQAIDACAKDGGGKVVCPSGVYLCGTIRLKSNVNLHLEHSSKLLAIDDESFFPEICKTPYGNLPGQIQALVWADNVDNVSITGTGLIDGGHPEALNIADAAEIKFRPALVFYCGCRDIKFIDVTLRNSSFWTLHLQDCDNVQVRGVSIFNNKHRINADGIDPDGCRNVLISDCHIECGDDSICIKSTEGQVCENISVANCILSTTCAALKLGTEAIGDIRNITFSNCVIYDSNVALSMYMKDGSTYENVLFSNIVVESKNQYPILLDVTPRYYRNPKKGRIRSVVFDNIIVNSPGRCFIEGLPDKPIENITFTNLTWNVTGELKTENARKPAGARRTEHDPEAINYACNPYQFTVANVDGFTIKNFRIYNHKNNGNDLSDRGVFYANKVTGGKLEIPANWQQSGKIKTIKKNRCKDLKIGEN